LPTRLLKVNIDVLALFHIDLLNWSLTLGVVPSAFKLAYITPLLKKVDLDLADAWSYRPISNLSVLLKLLERTSLGSLLTTSSLYSCCQGFRVPAELTIRHRRRF